MKKLLLNYKTLNFAIVLLLLSANSVFSQTVFEETFGTAANLTFTGGTSTTPSAVNYITNVNFGIVSTVLPPSGTDAFLQLTGSALANQATPTARPNIVFPYSGISSNFNTTLSNNTNTVTWSFNMRTGRLLSSSSQSYADGAYYGAVILCATNDNFAGGTGSGTNGYAVIFQRSSADATKNSIRLVKFSNGIGSSAGGSAVTPLIQTPAFALPSSVNQNNISIKVVYTKNAPNPWELFYREDSAVTPWATVDPLSGTLTSAGISSDITYTSTAMTHFGILASGNASTTPANNQQFDNFKISLSPLPTPQPSVEKRQSFNSTSNPTVANLVATGNNLNWYASATGGSPLTSNTPLSYSNYYVSQTINNSESARAISQIFVGDTSLRSLPFYENFSAYTAADKLIVINNDGLSGTGLGAWSVNSETTTPLSPDDVLIAAQPTTSWTSTVLPTPTGNALVFDKSGLDPQILFKAPSTGSVYASCMFMVTNLNAITSGSSGLSTDTPPAPGHFFSFGYSDGAGLPTAYTAAVFLKTSTSDATKFNIGINAAPATTIAPNDIFWDTTNYSVNTPITLVTNYSYDNYISKLWINPTSNLIEPTPNATTAARTLPLAVDRVRLTQQSSATTPFITLDEIRVANNWGEALGGASTLGLVNNSVSNTTLYPNPVSNGKLFIASTSNLEKEVTIFTTLGQQVLQDKTVSESINVANLSQGTYFVKITEAGLTTTKKLIIK